MKTERIGAFLFKIRSYTPAPFIFAALAFSNASAASMTIGFILVILGESLRIWAVGYAGPRTRATTLGAARDLVTTGPYSYTRNPIYLGNMLIILGFSIMADVRTLILLSMIWFPLQYWLIIKAEEDYLLRELGQTYKKYMQNVPRFLFRATPYLYRSNHDFSIRRALRSERQTLIGILLLSVLIPISARYWAI